MARRVSTAEVRSVLLACWTRSIRLWHDLRIAMRALNEHVRGIAICFDVP